MFQRSLKFLSFMSDRYGRKIKVCVVNLQQEVYMTVLFMNVSSRNALVMLVLTCFELKFLFLSVPKF